MNKTRTNRRISSYIFGVFLGLLLVGTTSCHRKGCTDPKANNYDSRSKKDDNTCKFDRENFIRGYHMTENCGGSFSYSLVISEQSEDASSVIIENLGGWVNEVNITALVSGTTLSFDDTSNGIRFQGTGSIDTETNILSLEYKSYDSDGEEISSCTSISG